MAGRRRAAPGFRPSASAATGRTPSRSQTVAMLVCLLVVALAIAVVSYAVKPARARSFHLVYGSVYLDDNTSPVAVDLASGKPTVRLADAFSAVSAPDTGDLTVEPLVDGTLMLNTASGEFNMVDNTGFVIKTTNGGVRLPTFAGTSTSRGVPAGESAYIVQSGTASSAIYLVSQATVGSAIGPAAKAKPRADIDLPTTISSAIGAAASAGGALWVLAGAASGTRTVTELKVPAGSNAGATLVRSTHGTTSGIAALSGVYLSDAGGGPKAMALAEPDNLRLFEPGGATRRIPIDGLTGVDAILPIRNLSGTAAYLYHSDRGWNLVSTAADGSGSARVSALGAIGSTSDLTVPAESDGRIYTMSTDDAGTLWQIAMDGTASPIAGAARYPVLPQEKSDLSDTEVVAEGSRVIFNSRANIEAEVIFTDGSRTPRTIDKHSAVQLSANGSSSLAAGRERNQENAKTPGKKKGSGQQGNKPKPKKTPAQNVNNGANCKHTTQTPHIPTVALVERGSRSVQLQWTYPLLDPQDCDPSTYTVSTKLLDSDAPAAPATIRVQGQTGVNLTGLFPDTRYAFTLTAYINGRGTASRPLTVSTTVEGPAAPTGVRTTVDSAGNWTIRWHSCGSERNGCVPTADWRIVPHFCDGIGLSAAPATRARIGDPSLSNWSYTYAGSDALLGRGLSFQVEGVGETDVIGDPAGDGTCSRSWTPPVAAAISIKAGTPPPAAGQATTQTAVSVGFRDSASHDLGGVGGTLTYQLLQGGRVVNSVGPTSRTDEVLHGIQPGLSYEVAVVAAPPGHSEASARIGPVDVDPAIARWPTLTLAASFHNTDNTFGTLSITPRLSSSVPLLGERFDLSDPKLICGNTEGPDLGRSSILPGNSIAYDHIDRSQLNGNCHVSTALTQNSGTEHNPPVFAGNSNTAGSDVSIPVPTLGDFHGDFNGKWLDDSPLGKPQIAVAYNGPNPYLKTYGDNWNWVVSNGKQNCGNSQSAPVVTIDVKLECIRQGGTFTVSADFRYFGVAHHAESISVDGSAPQPIDPSKISFSADWHPALLGGDAQVNVHIDTEYSNDELASLQWDFTVHSDRDPGVKCGESMQPPTTGLLGDGPQISVDLKACKPHIGTTPSNYTVDIHFHDPNYGGDGSYDPPVDGSPK